MANRRVTTFEERQRFVEQHQQGRSYGQIAAGNGWKEETVRKHCLAAAHAGVEALRPKKPGPAARGVLSTFDPLVRYAALRLKKEHPAWGPAVILDELRQRRNTRHKRLPGVSQLAAYFQQFGARLVQPRRHPQLPPALVEVEPGTARLVFQLDMQERLFLPALGYFNVVNIRAPQWGITVGCAPHPAGAKRWQRKVSMVEIRDDCRQAFTQWGLPDELRTDRDKVLVPSGDYPFPSNFTLWLVGLGVQHTLIQRVTQNGSVERCHRTFDKQMLSGCPAQDWSAFLAYVAAELKRLNERLPSRAKACHGQIPLSAHPEALTPRRPYSRTQEASRFSMERVFTYLAQGRWVRRASTHGQFKFADAVYSAGRRFENQPVLITFTPDTHEFVISTPEGVEIKRLPGTCINEAAIRGLADDEVGKVQAGM